MEESRKGEPIIMSPAAASEQHHDDTPEVLHQIREYGRSCCIGVFPCGSFKAQCTYPKVPPQAIERPR